MIRVQDLWKRYGHAHVLKGLSLVVPTGKTVVILGRSGVGKSVLLRQIIGLEDPDGGSIEINGICTTDMKRRARRKALGHVGMLFQSSALFDSMTVGQNVGFFLLQHGDPVTQETLLPAEIQMRTDAALEQVDLKGMAHKMPSELSGGQKRRAALARLIVYHPTVLLFDEPTTGLDPITSMQINQLIAKTQQTLGATAIVVTHDINSALVVGDYFALHNDGKIAFVDEKKRFIQNKEPQIRRFLENAMVSEEYARLIHQPTGAA